MTKYYPCVIMTQDEVAKVCNKPASFKDGYLTDAKMRTLLEDYLGHVIVTIRESTRHPDEIFLFLADGRVFYGMTGKRIAQIEGNFDSITTILNDIFEDCPNENPVDLFNKYRYLCPMDEQKRLNHWIKTIQI